MLQDSKAQLAGQVVSLDFKDWDNAEIAIFLTRNTDSDQMRTSLRPSAHKTLGTFSRVR